MKIDFKRTDSFLKTLPSDARIVLVYGEATSVVRERATRIARHVTADDTDPFQVAVLSGDDIAATPQRLHEEMSARSLMGGRRLVRIQHATDGTVGSALVALINGLADLKNDTVLVVEAGTLEKKSSIRTACENEKAAGVYALPCYQDDERSRPALVKAMLHEETLAADPDVIAHLCATLPLERDAMRQEIIKLALGKQPLPDAVRCDTPAILNVSHDDVALYLGDGRNADVDGLIAATLAGDCARATRLLDAVFAAQTDPIWVLRAMQRHMMRVHEAQVLCDSGVSPDDALKALKPPIFWKDSPRLKQEMRVWTASALVRALGRLSETEAMCKTTGMPNMTLCAQLFLNFGTYAAARRRR